MKSIVVLVVAFVVLYILGVWSVKEYIIPVIEKNSSITNNKIKKMPIDENKQLVAPSVSPGKNDVNLYQDEKKLNKNIDKYICPTCVIKDKQATQMELESNDSFESVSSWYKSIANKGHSSTVVTTNTNGIGNSVIKFSDDDDMKVSFLINNYNSKVNIKVSVL